MGGEGIDTLDYGVYDAHIKTITPQGTGIKIEADLARGIVHQTRLSGGDLGINFIKDIERVIGTSGDDVFKGKMYANDNVKVYLRVA